MAITKTHDAAQIQHALHEAYARFKNLHEGKNADYIPYLAKVPSHLFGIAVATVAGDIYAVGDKDYEFAIESVSKVFTLCRVLQEIGPAGLREKIGADPTGEPFNSVLAIELHQGRTLNPFVNAGAIATTSLVPGATAEERWGQIIGTMIRCAGRTLSVNDEVYQSESATNQHNRGIAWLLDSYGYMYNDPMISTDLYTRQCSVAITTCDLAWMAATLANGGVHPTTGERSIDARYVPCVLAEMTMNGLYEATGDWQYAVGLPGKSGVGGGIMAVVPGELGIAAFSPPLDRHGNSVRSQKAIHYLSDTLGLTLFAAVPPPG
jgi:glutaminase